jgi:hypothetical protein
MKQYIEIKADTDKESIIKKTEISDEVLKIIEPVIEAISNFEPYITEDGFNITHNFPWVDYDTINGKKSVKQLYVDTGLCNDKQILTFVDFCPSGEIHTITDVNVYVNNEEDEKS